MVISPWDMIYRIPIVVVVVIILDQHLDRSLVDD